MNNWIVSKFGGSSVKDGTAMLRCSYILENNPDIKITIISATYNTTNQLEQVARFSVANDEAALTAILNEIETKHTNIAKELFSSNVVYDGLKTLFKEIVDLSNQIKSEKAIRLDVMDQLYSTGERMSSLIFSDLLKLRMPNRKIVFFDAREVIKTNSDFKKAEPQIALIADCAGEKLREYLLDPSTLIVTQGFIGEDLNGKTTTLGREGSDYSAALFGEAINASLIQIWTDVEGVASSDPRHVKDFKYIAKLSYDEATALATLGAKVLFPRTLLPAKRKNIPVFVGSSIKTEAVGTTIMSLMDNEFNLKAVTADLIDGEQVLSFVGSHLEKNTQLRSIIENKLVENKLQFSFKDLTSVSLSYTFTGHSNVEAMVIGHSILTGL
jgi:aspartate kinase